MDSLQQQLAERRARLQQKREQQQNTNPTNDTNTDYANYANSQNTTDNYSNQQIVNDSTIDPTLSNVADIDQNFQNTDEHEPVLNQHDMDYELAMQLQRQFEQEESAQNEQPPQPTLHSHQFQTQTFPNMQFQSFSSSHPSNPNQSTSSYHVTYSSSTTDPDGNVRTYRYSSSDPFQQSPDQNAQGLDSFHSMNTALSHPFMSRHGMSAFGPNFGADDDSDVFQSFGAFGPRPMRQMRGMRGMNAMDDVDDMHGIHSMFQMHPMFQFLNNVDGHLFVPRPAGADQNDIETLPTDTYKARNKAKKVEPAQNAKADIDGDSEMEQKASGAADADDSEDEMDPSEQCSICLEPFKDGDTIRRLPCLHIFHQSEIDRWLRTNHVCPICRQPIEQSQ